MKTETSIGSEEPQPHLDEQTGGLQAVPFWITEWETHPADRKPFSSEIRMTLMVRRRICGQKPQRKPCRKEMKNMTNLEELLWKPENKQKVKEETIDIPMEDVIFMCCTGGCSCSICLAGYLRCR